MAPPKNPPAKPAGKIRVTMSTGFKPNAPKMANRMTRTTGFKPNAPKANSSVVAGIGKVANAIADRVPTAQKNAERKMRGNPQGGAPRG